MSILENIGAGIVSVALFLGGLFGYTPEPVYAPDVDEQALGADSVTYFGGQTYTLAGTGISSTGASFTLTSFTITQNGKKIQDSEMADTFYGTFEPGSRARQEFFSCTTVVQNADNTATISGCTRGLSPVAPYTASTSLQFAHGGGTSVIFSNTPQFYDQFPAKGNDEAISGDWTVPTPATNDSIANKAYVLSAITGTSTIATDKVQVGATAGETFATNTVVFFQESDQRWYKLDVDNEAHYVDREIGIANGPGSAGVNISGGVTVRGLVTMAGLTAGANYFASSTAGATSTATTSQPLGVARSATQLYFNPDLIDSSVYVPTTFTSTTTFTGRVLGGQTISLTASSTFTGATLPQPSFITVSSTATTSSASGSSTSLFGGFAISSASVGGQVTIQTDGIVPGFSGLTKGARYFIQNATGTIGTTPGTQTVTVGIAVSPTEILIEKKPRYASGVITFSASESRVMNLGFRPSTVRVNANLTISGGTAIQPFSKGGWTETSGNYAVYSGDDGSPGLTNGVESLNAWRLYQDTSPNVSHSGTVTGVTNSGFTFTNTKSNSPVDALIYWEAEGY